MTLETPDQLLKKSQHWCVPASPLGSESTLLKNRDHCLGSHGRHEECRRKGQRVREIRRSAGWGSQNSPSKGVIANTQRHREEPCVLVCTWGKIMQAGPKKNLNATWPA